MTDIRPVLRERLKSIDAELLNLTHRREQLTELRNSIEVTLNHEEIIHGDSGSASPVPNLLLTNGEEKTLSHIVMRALPGSLDQLKKALSSSSALRNHPSPGRAINFALVGLQKGGHVELVNGTWRLK